MLKKKLKLMTTDSATSFRIVNEDTEGWIASAFLAQLSTGWNQQSRNTLQTSTW